MSNLKNPEGIKEITTNVMHNLDEDPQFFTGDGPLATTTNAVKMAIPAGSKWFIPAGVPAWFTLEDGEGTVIEKVESMFNAIKTGQSWNTANSYWTQQYMQSVADVVHGDYVTQWWRDRTGTDRPLTVGVSWNEAWSAQYSQSFTDIGLVTEVSNRIAEGTKWFLNICIGTLLNAGAGLMTWQRLASAIIDDYFITEA